MARLGFVLQSVSIAVVFLAALACASGDNGSGGASGTGAMPGVTGGAGSGGQGAGTGATPGTGINDPLAGTGGSSLQPGGGNDTPPACGNNVVETNEICDGTDLAGATCDTLAAGQIGTLACSGDCLNYDTTMCYMPPPTTVEAGQDDGGYGSP